METNTETNTDLDFLDKPLTKLLSDRFVSSRVKMPMTSTSIIRASGFSFLCPREEAICTMFDITRSETVDPDGNTIFSLGHGMHWAMQNKILPAVASIYGRWTCLDCSETVGGLVEGKPLQDTLVLRPEECPKCKSPGEDMVYREMYFLNNRFKIGGHPDGFIKIPERPDLGVIEVKSISLNKSYEIQSVPDMGHVTQAQIYLWFTKLKWSIILYWIKGVNGLEGLVEHYVERDDEAIANIENTLKETWDGILGKQLPERICSTSTCARAKKCSVAKKCFEELS